MVSSDGEATSGRARERSSRTRALRLFARLTGDALEFPSRLAIATLSVVVLSASQLYFTWLIKLWVEGPLASGETASLTGHSWRRRSPRRSRPSPRSSDRATSSST